MAREGWGRITAFEIRRLDYNNEASRELFSDMETKLSRKMANEQIPERKPSYRKAVGANTTENQAKTAHFHNATLTSSDPVVVFTSDDGLNSSGSGKNKIESGF